MERQIQSYLRHAARRNRKTLQTGPFLATFTSHNTNPFLNYAIPNEEASPSPEDVSSLVSIYQKQGCIPRLEYLPQLAPAVEPALLAYGFQIEERMPLMTCEPGRLLVPSLPPDIELLAPTTDNDLFSMVAAQNEAYGDMVPGPEEVNRQRAFLLAGGIAVLARDQATGEAVGGGICNVPFEQTTELSSVGVRPAYRRRGIAASLTARLVQLAWAAEITLVFLMAAHEPEARVYNRIGFQAVGEVLDLRFPQRSQRG